jgi:hypothetical protein
VVRVAIGVIAPRIEHVAVALRAKVGDLDLFVLVHYGVPPLMMAFPDFHNILADAMITKIPAGMPRSVIRRKRPKMSPTLPTNNHPTWTMTCFGSIATLLQDPAHE